MSKPEVASDANKFQELAKESSKLQTVVAAYEKFKALDATLTETQDMLRQCEGEDDEMAEMAREEIEELRNSLQVPPPRSPGTSL